MTRKNFITGVAVSAGIAVIVLFFWVINPFGSSMNPTNGQAASTGSDLSGVNQLVAQDETVGSGPEAKSGDKVSVNYTGKLQNGTVFDTSVGKAPLSFTLGSGQVIPGWEQGIQGMKVGGKRLLIIPASLGIRCTRLWPDPP
jgi:FKBP-type peptidyl-prolyl cis-trans isomerase FkpA